MQATQYCISILVRQFACIIMCSQACLYMCVCHLQQQSEDEQLAQAIAASLGQESTSLPAALPPAQANGKSLSSVVRRWVVPLQRDRMLHIMLSGMLCGLPYGLSSPCYTCWLALSNPEPKTHTFSKRLYSLRHPKCNTWLSHPKDEHTEHPKHLGIPVCCLQRSTQLVFIVPGCKFIYESAMSSTSMPMCQKLHPIHNHMHINTICGKHTPMRLHMSASYTHTC